MEYILSGNLATKEFLLILRNDPCKKGIQELEWDFGMRFTESKQVFTAFGAAFKYIC
jgi:hypothetical protein